MQQMQLYGNLQEEAAHTFIDSNTNLYFTPAETLNQLYVYLVRPHLEYAAPVWDPHLQKDIDKLESVQTFAL